MGVYKSALVVVGVEQREEGLAGLSRGAGGELRGGVLWAAYRGTAGGICWRGERGSRCVWSGGEQGLVFAESGRASVVGGVAGGRCHVLARASLALALPVSVWCGLWLALSPSGLCVSVQRQRKASQESEGRRDRQVQAGRQAGGGCAPNHADCASAPPVSLLAQRC